MNLFVLRSKIIDEIEERERRSRNAICFNVPVLKNQDGSEVRYIEVAKKLMSDVAFADADSMVQAFRFGKPKPNGAVRPLMIRFKAKADRNLFLQNCRQAQLVTDDQPPLNLWSKADLTPDQREAELALVQELKRRRAGGDEVIIRYGKIVPKNVIVPDQRL